MLLIGNSFLYYSVGDFIIILLLKKTAPDSGAVFFFAENDPDMSTEYQNISSPNNDMVIPFFKSALILCVVFLATHQHSCYRDPRHCSCGHDHVGKCHITVTGIGRNQSC